VREFITLSAARLGLTLKFQGQGLDEVGIVASVMGDAAPAVKAGDVIVRIDPRYFRPAEVETLLGDPTKAKERLGWTPQITLAQLIDEMVASDLEEARRHALLRQHGFKVAVSQE
jgi:GDPmannose 4,6-dehydratase